MKKIDYTQNNPYAYYQSQDPYAHYDAGSAYAESSGSGWEDASLMESGGQLQGLQSGRTSLAPVQPRRSTRPGGSWPCEQIAAQIENKTSLSILLGQYDEVCGRLMQAKKNENFFKGMSRIELGVVFMNVFLTAMAKNTGGQFFHGAMAVGGVISAIPHVGVSNQFSQIKQKCEEALRSRFGDGFLKQINKLSRDEKGFEKAIRLLQENSESTDFLEQKLNEFRERGYSSSRVAQLIMDVAEWDR